MKVALDRDTYSSVFDMLNSSDKENVIVGLSIIEATDRKNGMACILLLKKRAKTDNALWKEHAPLTCKWLKLIGADPEEVITFKKILQIISENKTDSSQVQFFLDEFGKHLMEQMQQMGYDFIETLEIKMKLKTDEQNGLPG